MAISYFSTMEGDSTYWLNMLRGMMFSPVQKATESTLVECAPWLVLAVTAAAAAAAYVVVRQQQRASESQVNVNGNSAKIESSRAGSEGKSSRGEVQEAQLEVPRGAATPPQRSAALPKRGSRNPSPEPSSVSERLLRNRKHTRGLWESSEKGRSGHQGNEHTRTRTSPGRGARS